MTINLFDPKMGIFLGENFADDLPMRQGREALPPYATTVLPPPSRCGEVAVFTVDENKWEIRLVAATVNGDGSESSEHSSHLPRQQTLRQTH